MFMEMRVLQRSQWEIPNDFTNTLTDTENWYLLGIYKIVGYNISQFVSYYLGRARKR